MGPASDRQSIVDRQLLWKALRPDALTALAATMTVRQISDTFGVSDAAVRSRFALHGLSITRAIKSPRRTFTHHQIIPCGAITGISPCGAPLEPDGTCRWVHQHTEES